MLTQAEAEQLMLIVKHFIRPLGMITVPPGADNTYELSDPSDSERFLLDVSTNAAPFEIEVSESGASGHNSGQT